LAPRVNGAIPSAFKTRINKALIWQKAPTEEILEQYKAAGFQGIEGGVIGPEAAAKGRALAEKVGMRFHSVLRGWAEANNADEAKVKASLEYS